MELLRDISYDYSANIFEGELSCSVRLKCFRHGLTDEAGSGPLKGASPSPRSSSLGIVIRQESFVRSPLWGIVRSLQLGLPRLGASLYSEHWLTALGDLNCLLTVRSQQHALLRH